MTEWLWRINVIIPIADKNAMNALWTVIAPNGDAEALSFGVPLSPSGNEPPTHSAISTAATEEMRILIESIFALELIGAVVSVQPYTENDFIELIAANGLQEIQEAFNG